MNPKTRVWAFALIFTSQVFFLNSIQADPSISNGFIRLFHNQHILGGIPDDHIAFYRFFNPADPVARLIGLRDSTLFDPENIVELNPGEGAFAGAAWYMFVVNGCEGQMVRPVVDFESPACQLPGDADPDTLLNLILSLPEECLGPAVDACQLFNTDLAFDFATDMAKARNVLTEIKIGFVLDGNRLASAEGTKPFKYEIPEDPEGEPLVCVDELYYSPIYAYFTYGYVLPPQEGACMLKGSLAAVSPIAVKGQKIFLTPGLHELLIRYDIPGAPFEAPVSILQK